MNEDVLAWKKRADELLSWTQATHPTPYTGAGTCPSEWAPRTPKEESQKKFYWQLLTVRHADDLACMFVPPPPLEDDEQVFQCLAASFDLDESETIRARNFAKSPRFGGASPRIEACAQVFNRLRKKHDAVVKAVSDAAAKTVSDVIQKDLAKIAEIARVAPLIEEENKRLREANEATSKEYLERVEQFRRELPLFPDRLIYDLRFDKRMSYDAIVEYLREKNIPSRTKKDVMDVVKRIKKLALETKLTLQDRCTEPDEDKVREGHEYDDEEQVTTRIAVIDVTPSTLTAKVDLLRHVDGYFKLTTQKEKADWLAFYGKDEELGSDFVKEVQRREGCDK